MKLNGYSELWSAQTGDMVELKVSSQVGDDSNDVSRLIKNVLARFPDPMPQD